MRRVTSVDVMLLVTVLLWALNLTVSRYILTHGFRPLAYTSVRYSAAAVLFAGLAYRLERSLRIGRRDGFLIVLAAAGVLWLNQLAFVYALQLTNASTLGLVFGVTPIFVALIAAAAGVERLARRVVVAALASFAGVGLVAAGAGSGFSADAWGLVAAVATAATWAGYTVAITPLMRRHSPFRISALVLLLASLLIVVTGLPQLAEQDYSLGWVVWAGLAFATLGPLVITNVLYFTAIDRVGPSRATLYTNLQPFVAVVFAVLLLSESLTLLQVGGGVAIAVGILIARHASAAPVE